MRTIHCLILLVPVLTLAACSDASSPAGAAAVSLSFATLQATGTTTGDRGTSTSPSSHTLVLSSAEIVLDHIELAPASVTCPDADDNDAGDPDGNRARVSVADDGRDDNDACEDIAQGPVIVDLPVG